MVANALLWPLLVCTCVRVVAHIYLQANTHTHHVNINKAVKKGFLSDYHLRRVGKVWRKQEAPRLVTFVVRNQRVMDADTQTAFTFPTCFSVQGLQPLHPSLGLHSPLNLSRNALTGMPPLWFQSS